MKITLRILLLMFATMLGTWAVPAEARDRDRGRSYYRGGGRSYYNRGYTRSYRGRSYYSRGRYGRSYYGRPYYRGYSRYGYGRGYGYYRRPVVVYDSPYYYDDYYYGRPYYSRPAISIGIGGRRGFFRGIF
jgi:hypothetical protein